ncbi:rRNA methyltransferase 3, mitochondrial [Aplysia californica]|uniref:rRNA methyltransferase 3, mitochondrial n=1 Tax=Aplysia californica TaxID=6500 RepID=A0ABM1AEC7_APLCA|nr:rRNA methyltransferase 3, mitochondrial [Aplysia californica]
MSLASKLIFNTYRSTSLGAFCRSYSRHKRVTKRKDDHASDPRKSTRYPFVPGDPVQGDAIRSLAAGTNIAVRKNPKPTTTRTIQKIKSQTNLFRTDSGLQYEKIMEGDYRLGRTILAAKAGKSQGQDDTIVLEGTRLIRDALLLGAEPKFLYFTDPAVLDKLPAECLAGVGLMKILYRDMKTWSDTTTPSGLLGVFKKPHAGEVSVPRDQTLPITVVMDGLKDPGNAGTIIRTAAAVGCERVIAVRGTVNIWEGKVVRSAMGGHFSVPLHWGLSWAEVGGYVAEDSLVLLADTQDGRMLDRAFDHTMSLEELDKLGVQDEGVYGSDTDTEATEQSVQKAERQRERWAYPFHKVPMAVCDYSQLQLPPGGWGVGGVTPHTPPTVTPTPPSITLVLGGETQGLSGQAKKFAFDRYGQYVTIPMCPSVDSLNTAVAAGVILYELRRRLVQ